MNFPVEPGQAVAKIVGLYEDCWRVIGAGADFARCWLTPEVGIAAPFADRSAQVGSARRTTLGRPG